VPRFFAGRLPDLNLGTSDGASCEPSVQALARVIVDGKRVHACRSTDRFKGGYITRRYGGRRRRARACSSRWRRPATWTKPNRSPFDAARAAPLAVCSSGSRSCAVRMASGFARDDSASTSPASGYDAYLVARPAEPGRDPRARVQRAQSSIAGDVPPDVAQPQVWIADDADAPRAQALLREMELEAARTHDSGLLPQVRRAVARELRPVLELRHGST
jgi:hypothetical protein